MIPQKVEHYLQSKFTSCLDSWFLHFIYILNVHLQENSVKKSYEFCNYMYNRVPREESSRTISVSMCL